MAIDDAWFTSNGQQIILDPSDKKLEAWRTTHGTRLTPAVPGEVPGPFTPAEESSELKTLRQRLQPRHPGEITRLVFNPAKNLLASGSTDKFARLWDAQTLELKVELPHEVTVNCVAFSADGARLATSTATPTRVRIWDVETGQPLSEWISVKEPVSAVAFSSVGDFLISSAGWKWQLHPVSGKPPAWLADLAEAVGGVRYNSNGIPETLPADSFERVLHGMEQGPARLTDWLREFAGHDGAKTQ